MLALFAFILEEAFPLTICLTQTVVSEVGIESLGSDTMKQTLGLKVKEKIK